VAGGMGSLKSGDRRQEAKLHEYADLLGVRHGISLLSETEKAAQGGLFLFLLYKFRISD
jgi:hypothetical protein